MHHSSYHVGFNGMYYIIALFMLGVEWTDGGGHFPALFLKSMG